MVYKNIDEPSDEAQYHINRINDNIEFEKKLSSHEEKDCGEIMAWIGILVGLIFGIIFIVNFVEWLYEKVVG